MAGVGSRERAEAAVRMALEHLCRRLGHDGGRLASLLGDPTVAVLDEPPDRSINLDTIAARLKERLGILPDSALEILLAICDAAGEGIGDRLHGTLGQMASNA